MKFDDIFLELGELGPYQKRVVFLICVANLLPAVQLLGTVFTLAIPPHRCAVPDLDNDTFASQGPWHDDVISLSVPRDSDDEYTKCQLFVPQGLNYTNQTESCSRYVYSREVFTKNAATEFDLVCSKSSLKTYANMILMSGLLVGSLVLGTLPDLIGRKNTFLISFTGVFATSLGLSFVQSYEAFVVLKFLSAFFIIGSSLSLFVLGMEFVGPRKRLYIGLIREFFWCASEQFFCGLAFLLRDWRHLKLATSVPFFFYFSYYWLLPESPRWLISKGRLEEAREILKKVAKGNGVTLSEKVISLEDIEHEGQKERIWHMFTTPKLLGRSLIIFYNWCVVSMVYYGLTLNVSALSGNIFLNFTFYSIAGALSVAFDLALLDVWGRKAMLCFTMSLGGVACLATLFPVIFSGPGWVTSVLSMVGKFGVSAGFIVIYIYSAELFPTCARNSGMGLSSFSARIGGILAPYIADLGHVLGGDLGVALPLVIFGSMCLMAGGSALLLPETLNRKLPDTVEDAKNIGKLGYQNKHYALETRPPMQPAAEEMEPVLTVNSQ